MPKLLEVIVTSVEEAIEAEAGGADRLELVRNLAEGGLTPDAKVVADVLAAVALPVRVMLRRSPTMSAGSHAELQSLQSDAESFGNLAVDGLVAGFIDNHVLDLAALVSILSAAPQTRCTFHRAFDELADPAASLEQLKRFPRIDRILTVGGKGSWPERKQRLLDWQQGAGNALTILVGAGLSPETLADLAQTPELREVHIGRAARIDHSVTGRIDRRAVQSLKSALR